MSESSAIGLILFASAILLPWLFLQESFDVQVFAEDVQKMTPIAQELVQYRQYTALWFFEHIIVISLSTAFIGFLFLLGGLVPWWRKQKGLDKKDDLEIAKLEIETRSMSQEQILAKGIEDVSEESQNSEAGAASEATAEEHLSAVQEYFRAEDIVIDKLIKSFGSSKVLPHKKIGTSEVDILVRLNSRTRAIFEIKRASTSRSINRQYDRCMEFLAKALKAYEDIMPERDVIGVGIIIVDDDYSDELALTHHGNYETTRRGDKAIMTMIYTEKDFSLLDHKELRRTIEKFARV